MAGKLLTKNVLVKWERVVNQKTWSEYAAVL